MKSNLGGNWSNIQNLIQCGTNNSSFSLAETFDNVFVNQTVTLTRKIPSEYVYQNKAQPLIYDPNGQAYTWPKVRVYSALFGVSLGDSQSEEHLPLLVTIPVVAK